MRDSNPYLRALASPGALRFSAAGFLGRLQIAMFGLGTVLLISSLSGRYGLAGAVAAAGAAGYALVSPLVARLADRAGQRAVLRPLMLVFAAATAALIAGAQARAPAWVLLAASGLAGAATPQLGSMVRARWSALLAGSPLLHAAFSLESVAPRHQRELRRPAALVLGVQRAEPVGVEVADHIPDPGPRW
jgi:MFS family permease